MYTLGVDVAKNKLDVGLLNPENDQRRAKTVPNTPEGFTELRDGLIRQKVPDLGQVHLILEATGVYHEPVALWFFAAGASVSVVNPAQTKAFGQGLAVRTKTDARDSHVLARYGALVQPALWQPPTPEIRELHALIARLDAVEADLRREQNRQEKAEVVPRPAPVTESLTQHIDFLKAEATRLQTALQDHIDRHPSLRQDRDLWLSIPAVGEKTAQRWVAVLRSRPFQSADQATAFLGLVPIECQSGSSLHRRPRLSKAGAPASAPPCTWPPSWPLATTPTSKHCMSACWPGAKPRWRPWAPPCANSSNWRSEFSNISNLTKRIGLLLVDNQDGIYPLADPV
jgi:transposase